MSAPIPTLVDSKPVAPEILDWANGQFSDEEALAALREIRANGGFELCEFAHELDRAAGTDERSAQ